MGIVLFLSCRSGSWIEPILLQILGTERLLSNSAFRVKTYYPAAEMLLGEQLTTPMASDFLARWPDLDTLQKASANTLRAFFFKHNSRNSEKIQARLGFIARARALTTDPAIILPARLRVSALVRMLTPLHQAIDTLEAQIERLMDKHPDREIFRSFPGAGPCLAPRLLVAFGTNRERFRSAIEVAQFYGIAPVIQQSGTTKTVHARTRFPKFGRQTYHENAGCALREELWASAFHRCYKDKHDSRHHQANRALAFKLVRVYFACWKNRTPYDPEKYEAALEASGSPYAATRRALKTVNNSKRNS